MMSPLVVGSETVEMAFRSRLASRLSGTLRLYSQAAKTIEITGQKFVANNAYTNVTPSIVELTDRALHLKESHPVGILREAIEKKLNSTDGAFTLYNKFKPVVTKFENFDSLGFPDDHPGRSKSDTYYVDDQHLLRTHTSAHEMECFSKIRNGESEKPGFLISADVYRRDEIDRTHYPVFHQMEGCRVWKRGSVGDAGEEPAHITQLRSDLAKLEKQLSTQATRVVVEDDTSLEGNPKQSYMTDLEVDLCSRHLKRSIELVMAEVFQKKLESMKKAGNTSDLPAELRVRWIKAYFPWTAPSWEIEVWWQGEWLELCGCGLTREDVLQRAGFQSESIVSWAFGLGLDRIAMLLFEIPDIRLFWTKDDRFHSQFHKEVISTFRPYSKYPGTLRDVAFWLPKDEREQKVHENDIMEIVRNVAGDLIESVKLVDQFQHPKTGRVSLCYRINYQSMDRNITNSEINALQEQVRRQLAETYGVELR